MSDILALLAIQQAAAGGGPQSNLNYYQFDAANGNISGNGELTCIHLSPNGLKLTVKFSMGQSIKQYTLPTAFDIGSLDGMSSTDLAGSQSYESSFCFREDGLVLFTFSGSSVKQYNLSTAYDIGSAMYAGSSPDSMVINNNPGYSGEAIYAGCFNSDGSKFFAIGSRGGFSSATFGLHIIQLNSPYELIGGTTNTNMGPSNFKQLSGSPNNAYVNLDSTGNYLMYSVNPVIEKHKSLALAVANTFIDAVDLNVNESVLRSDSMSAPTAGGYYERNGEGYFITHTGNSLMRYTGPPIGIAVTYSSITSNSISGVTPGSTPSTISLYVNSYDDVNAILLNNYNASSPNNSSFILTYNSYIYTFKVGSINVNNYGNYEIQLQSITNYIENYVGGSPGSSATLEVITYIRDTGGGGGGGGGPTFYDYTLQQSGPNYYLDVRFTTYAAQQALLNSLASLGNQITISGMNMGMPEVWSVTIQDIQSYNSASYPAPPNPAYTEGQVFFVTWYNIQNATLVSPSTLGYGQGTITGANAGLSLPVIGVGTFSPNDTPHIWFSSEADRNEFASAIGSGSVSSFTIDIPGQGVWSYTGVTPSSILNYFGIGGPGPLGSGYYLELSSSVMESPPIPSYTYFSGQGTLTTGSSSGGGGGSSGPPPGGMPMTGFVFSGPGPDMTFYFASQEQRDNAYTYLNFLPGGSSQAYLSIYSINLNTNTHEGWALYSNNNTPFATDFYDTNTGSQQYVIVFSWPQLNITTDFPEYNGFIG